MSFALTIPDPTRSPVPKGWAEQVFTDLQVVEDIEDLDTGRASLQGYVAAWKSKGYQTAELQSALRFVEVRLGELLGPPARTHSRDAGAKSVTTDLAKDQRYEFRRLAWPERHRELALEAVRNGKRSRGAVWHYIDEHTQKPTDGPVEVRHGDFREVLANLEPDSVDLVLTDPPYPAEFLPLWSDLAEFAARVLVPGGSLLAYSGQGNLPDVLRRLDEHLRYWWTLALEHGHGSQNLPGKFVTIGWKPVVWFVKDGRRDRSYVADRVRGTDARKTQHPWGQGRDELKPLIQSLTAQGQLVVDPFAGSGTVGEAAVALGRRFVGAETNV